MTRSHHRKELRGVVSRRRGFTMIDLLATIVIIGFLGALVLGAVGMARRQTQIRKTEYLIDKLNKIMMTQYESYRTRRVPMDLRAYVLAHKQGTAEPFYTVGNNYEYLPREIARARVNAVRDLMRLEMPDRWSDIIHAGDPNTPDAVCLVLEHAPALTHRYRRIYLNSKAYSTGNTKWGAAECLYMIVMAIPGAAEQFRQSEVGDVDNDGLPEFHDAWGRPIRFLRWPSGFYYDPNYNYYGQSDIQFGPQSDQNKKYQADPFDSQGVMTSYQDGFAIYPLIYSAGPDGEFDINIGKVGKDTTYAYKLDDNGNINPFTTDGNNHQIGLPYNNDGDPSDSTSFYKDLRHYDNVTNQQQHGD